MNPRQAIYAMAVGLVVLTCCNASAQNIESPLSESTLPRSPTRPTSLGECEALKQKLSLAIQKLKAAREQCIRSEAARAGTESRCRQQQTALDSASGKAHQQDIRCRRLVAEQRDQQRRDQERARAQREAAAKAEAQRAAARNARIRTSQEAAQVRRQAEEKRTYAAASEARQRNAAAARATAQRSAAASRKRH